MLGERERSNREIFGKQAIQSRAHYATQRAAIVFPWFFPRFYPFSFFSLFLSIFFCHSMFAGTSRERLSKSRRVRSAPAKRSLLWLITKCQGEGGGGGGGGKSLYSGSV